MLTITIEDPKAFVGFDDFRRTYMGFTNREVLKPVALEIERRLRTYPPARRYIRTYTYQRSWRTYESFGNKWEIHGFASYAGNPNYTSLVIGDEDGRGQAPIHYGWWPVGFTTGKDLVEKTSKEFARKADAQYVRFIQSKGL